MGNINRPPLGLLSLLDSQTQGQAPATLEERVTAGIDLTPFWLNARGLEVIASAAAAQLTSGQSNVSVTVPQNEIWAVVAVAGRAYCGDVTATNHTIYVTWKRSASSTANTHTLAQSAVTSLVGVTAIGAATVTWSTAAPFFAPPGSQFGMGFNVATALSTGSIPEVSVVFYRLQV